MDKFDRRAPKETAHQESKDDSWRKYMDNHKKYKKKKKTSSQAHGN